MLINTINSGYFENSEQKSSSPLNVIKNKHCFCGVAVNLIIPFTSLWLSKQYFFTMSPDPPREESGDDDDDHIRSFNGELFEGVMDDQEFFIVPDAPYELDMEDESEYSDSEDDGHPASSNSAVPNSNSVQVTHEQEFLFEGQRQGRGRYRLLIPFPAANAATTATPTPANSINDTTPSNNASSMDMTTVTGGESEPTADTERERPGSDECTAAQTTQSSTPSKTDEILSETVFINKK